MKTLFCFLTLALASAGANSASATASTSIAERVTRSKIAGIDVIAYPTSVKDVVTIVGSLPAGDVFAPPGNAAVPTLAGMMLDRGTTREDKFAIARRLEEVGAQIGFSVDTQMVGIQARCLKKDLPLVIGLIAEQLRMPAFAPEEFEKVRQQFVGSIRSSIEDTNFRAQDAFSRAVFPQGHPNRQPSSDEYLAAANGATLDEVKAFHKKHYGPAHMTLVLVGDLDVPRIKPEVNKAFAGWTGGVEAVRPATSAGPQAAARDEVVALAGKTSVSIVMGQGSGLRYKDPDTLALRVGTAILGSGFTGRLMSTVRDKEGLTYGIGAGVGGDTFTDGSWSIGATFAPQLLDKGIASTRRELGKWWTQGVTAKEVADRKESLIGGYQVGLATTAGLAGALLAAVQRGYDVTWLDEYPQAIAALTVEQVNAAIKKHLDPNKMVLVKAGTVK